MPRPVFSFSATMPRTPCPRPMACLGLRQEDLHRHIAYDMGAAGVAERLAKMLGAPAVLSRFSRLLIDPNRGLDDPTLIMQISDGLIVPGNVGLDESEVASRIDASLRALSSRHRERGRSGARGRQAAGYRLGAQLHPGLEGRAEAVVSGRAYGTRTRGSRSRCSRPCGRFPASRSATISRIQGSSRATRSIRHGTTRGLAHALIEVRQDLILSEEGQAEWAGRLAEALRKVMREESALHAIELHGSYTDGMQRRSAAKPCEGEPRPWTRRRAPSSRRRLSGGCSAHLRERSDVENIDLMELAGFCRNCLSGWYQEAAEARGIALSKEEAREIVYGMALRGVEGEVPERAETQGEANGAG